MNTLLPDQYNLIQGSGGFGNADSATHPANKVIVGKHILVVDSRTRDCKCYPNPSKYRIAIGDIYKNITSIELKGAIIPKSAYNVHSTNKYIDFAIGDSITQINLKWGGNGYTTPPLVTITSPSSGGTQAEATAVLTGSSVTSITLDVAGSGYSPSNPPIISIECPPMDCNDKCNNVTPACAEVIVGIHYTACIREGQYVMGGNPDLATSVVPTDLVLEIQNAMNYVVNGGAYDPVSVSPFEVRLVNQYPELDAVVGTPEAADTNACLFNRLQITNIDSEYWELLFCDGCNNKKAANKLMGFSWANQTDPTATPAVVTGAGTLIQAGTTLRGSFDYDLTDDPQYVILSFEPASSSMDFERIESDDPSLNKKFASLIFDANQTDVLKDLGANVSGGGSVETVGGIRYLDGALGKQTFWSAPGLTKPLKGYDFDNKYLEFSPPIGKLAYLNILFTKYGQTSGGLPMEYNFQGRDHFLIFEISAEDTNSQNRY